MIVIGELAHTFRMESLLILPSLSEEILQLKDGGTRKVKLQLEKYVSLLEGDRLMVRVKATLLTSEKGELLSGIMKYKDNRGHQRARVDVDVESKESKYTCWVLFKEDWLNTEEISLCIQILSDKAIHRTREADREMQRNSASALLKDYAALQKKEIMSDVTIVCDGARFPAHKLILSARSEVFAAMFSHKDTLESQQNEVTIKDLTKLTVETFLNFIYSGAVNHWK